MYKVLGELTVIPITIWGLQNKVYSAPNINQVIKSRMRWAEHVACMGARRGVYGVLVGKPDGKRPLGTQA
jgi:hypothetical protein